MKLSLLGALFVLLAWTSMAATNATNVVVTKSYQNPYDIVRSVRTNGCELELRRYSERLKPSPSQKGFWVQEVYVAGKLLLKITHSSAEKQQVLIVARNEEFGIAQLDRDLDGRYETILVASLKDQALKDVLIVTAEGPLRHGSIEEFETFRQRGENNTREMKESLERLKKLTESSKDASKK